MKHRVLCIDDESHNLEALERLLRKQYDVTITDSGKNALKELEKKSFSLIISDQKMPEMTGVEFFMEAKEIQPEAIRILLTGYTDLESVISAINQGQIYRYITKPWDPDEFMGIVKQAIEVFDMKGTIEKQNRKLKEANVQLQSLDKMKSDFMVLVNHELKTPLTGIFSFVQLLNEEKLTDDQKLYIERISKNTQRLQDLINDTLLITRLQANQEQLSVEELDIQKIISAQWAELEKQFPKTKLTLDITNKKAFSQTVNKKYIEIIIKKILHNCFAHGKNSESVIIKLTNSTSHWKLNIKNPSEKPIEKDVKQLLTAFSTDEKILNHSGGTGLGLAVIQGALNLFSGEIKINTKNQVFDLTITIPK